MKPVTLHYSDSVNLAFQQVLQSRVNDYFARTGQHKKANRRMWLKAAFFFVWMVAGYWLLLNLSLSAGLLAMNYLFFGFGSLFFVITVSHDASHGAFSRSRKVNSLLAWSWNLVGMSHYFWALKHNESHHAFTNIDGHDQDLSMTKLFRFSKFADWSWFHRYQHFYAPVLYALFGVFAVTARDFILLKTTRFGNRSVHHPTGLALGMAALKTGYLTLALGMPIWLIRLPAWQVAGCYLLMQFLVSLYITIILIAPHLNEEAPKMQVDETGRVPADWASHQVECSVDFSPSSRLLSWFAGGLNNHVAHHLYPSTCHIHYPNLTPIIRETAAEFGILYRKTSLWAALVNHYRHLRQLSVA